MEVSDSLNKLPQRLGSWLKLGQGTCFSEVSFTWVARTLNYSEYFPRSLTVTMLVNLVQVWENFNQQNNSTMDFPVSLKVQNNSQ